MVTNPSRPKADTQIVVYTRIDPAAGAALDAIRGKMRPKPTRAQWIDAALAAYVERPGEYGRAQEESRQ